MTCLPPEAADLAELVTTHLAHWLAARFCRSGDRVVEVASGPSGVLPLLRAQAVRLHSFTLLVSDVAAARAGSDPAPFPVTVRSTHPAAPSPVRSTDVWQRVATRRTDPDCPAAMTAALVENAHLLLTANAATTASPLHHTPTWPAAFTTAGVRLAELAATGLTRGLRAVLTHHLLFGFNRLGIPATHQHRLATAAVHAVFGEEPMSSHPVTDHEIDREADRLRQGLADHIRGRGTFHTAAVEKAFRVVPRHAFLPDVPLPDAYAARPVVTRRDTDGSALSSASSPNLVAGMLELLDVAPGQQIMEIGAATGINAALLAELTGSTGHVTTIEIDDGLAQGARNALARTGYPTVTVISGDGALGHPPAAPFDRIIVTAGAWDIPAAWWQQLAPDGRVVIPLRLHASGFTRVLPLTRHTTDIGADTLVSVFALVCGFVPMRGTGEHAENMVRLTEDVILNVDIDDHPDPTLSPEP